MFVFFVFGKIKTGDGEGGGSCFFYLGGGENLGNLWEIKMRFLVGESVLLWWENLCNILLLWKVFVQAW